MNVLVYVKKQQTVWSTLRALVAHFLLKYSPLVRRKMQTSLCACQLLQLKNTVIAEIVAQNGAIVFEMQHLNHTH